MVYKAKREDEDNSKIRVLHRNVIMKINDKLDNFNLNIRISQKEKVKQARLLKLVARKQWYNGQTAMRKELRVTKNIPYNSHQTIYTCNLEVVKIMEKV